MKWKSIRYEHPEVGEPVLFRRKFEFEFHVGYWDEAENGMVQYDPRTRCEGWKWDCDKWISIAEIYRFIE